ncbi:unnamed protein product [Microthlaspi erraticum]|uniref:MATH domain-containing protein n=1 Tax=Microthlaspi erraticum TaxID=1685480 RepID=A0A6D2L774_9BRAS|nr:unnamed protein product [Microthlaspi erraticum]
MEHDDRDVEKLTRNSVLIIRDVSSLQSESEKIYSYPFVVGCCSWRVGVYYKGNKYDDSLSLSLSLVVSDADFMPPGWKRHAQFSFTIVNQISEELDDNCGVLTETQEWFDHKTPAWDFSNSIPLGKLDAKHAKHGGFIVDGKVKIVVDLNVLEAVGKYEDDEDFLDFYGLPVYPSEMEVVSPIFEEHPDFASHFVEKDLGTYFKRVVIQQLILLIKDLRKPLKDISFYHAHHTLVYLKAVGLDVGWLEKKVSDLKEQKETDQQEEIESVGYPE